MTRTKLGLVLAGVLLLGGCVAHQQPMAEPDVVARAAYVPPGPSTVTLLTMVNNTSGAGGHSALLIDGQQRVLFDPAGSWYHPNVPERADVLFGMSPQFMEFYMDYHARETFHVVVQEIEVSPAVAATLIERVQQHGAANRAECAASVSSVLRGVPGFETVSQSWFPRNVMMSFGRLPGVQTSQVFDDDSDDNLELLQAQGRQAALREEIADAN
ncbi:MAG: hypothetical protein AAF825_01590 [Pseudomonadota bacterium]